MNILKSNWPVIVILVLYSVLILNVITWGIPNLSHPFTYHMDEWHQLEAVRGVFKNGSNNINGAAHGPIFHFVLSGIYILPFYLLKIVNPFLIKSSTSQLLMQERLFVLLRISTLLYGIGTIILLYAISKKFFKINPYTVIIPFTFTPLWLSLSTYFKYDIAVTFWITLFIFFCFTFKKQPSRKNYIILSISSGLALSSKISVIPIVLIFILVFFLFNKKSFKDLKTLVSGIVCFISTFIICGIPDLPFHVKDYIEFIYSNIVTVPSSTSNYKFGMPYFLYAFFITLPSTFGYLSYVLIVLSIVVVVSKIILSIRSTTKKHIISKDEIFLFVSFLIFLQSIVPLQLFAWGNRALVLTPFIALLCGIYFDRILKKLSILFQIGILVLFLVIQLFQSAPVFLYKINSGVRVKSSEWIVNHIPKGTTIGIENIPIYQSIPDISLMEFYVQQNDKDRKTLYSYQVIDKNSKAIPSVVVITERGLHENYLYSSEKKDLIARLSQEGYKISKEFYPYKGLYSLFYNDLGIFASGIVAEPTITIYQKDKNGLYKNSN